MACARKQGQGTLNPLVASSNISSGPSGGLTDIPQQNLRFRGREDILQAVADTLQKYGRAALVGMPGVGKTHTALAFLYSQRKEYEYVFWIVADSVENLRTGYDDVAKRLRLAPAHSQDQDVNLRATLEWFTGNSNFLLVLDNADDISAYEHLVPKTSAHLLFTARSNSIKTIANTIRVLKMKESEGADCLLAWAGIREPTPQQRVQAEAVSTDLGGLPLALQQAGAFIAASEGNIALYRSLLTTHRSKLLKKNTGLPKDFHTVYDTFTLALTKLNKRHDVALDLLRLCAFIAPEAIPESLFTSNPKELSKPLCDVATDPLEWEELLQAITYLALIERDVVAKTFSVHRLVQDVLLDGLDRRTQSLYVKLVVKALCRAWPDIATSTWEQCKPMMNHISACFPYVKSNINVRNDSAAIVNSVATMYEDAAYHLNERGQYLDSELYLVYSLAVREHLLGREHPDTAESINNLAYCYSFQGKEAIAESLYIRALEIREKVSGAEHHETATSISNLGVLYTGRREYDKAEPLLVRALAIREKIFGDEDIMTASSLNNLASLYDRQGEHSKAEPLYIRALRIFEKNETQRTSVATTLNNLANVYESQGRYTLAQQTYVRSVAIHKEVADEHHGLAASLNNLAFLYQKQGLLNDAEQLFRQAALMREKVLGVAHLHTADSFKHLAEVLQSMGHHDEAKEMYAKVQDIRDAYQKSNSCTLS